MTTTIERPAADASAAPVTSPRWEWIGLVALLVGTGVAYIWGLGASGWANSFYSAAVQAGSVSWKAFFFGSSDAANSITVDKPPMSLWLMSLSVRIFGLNTWAMLVPQALLGVASVALLRATVKRRFGGAAGLLAGLVLAVTPVAALMFRFNNPDALLVLLMIASVWALLRGVETGKTKWLLITGMFVGFGFLTKQLQVMLVVPPLALTYLIAGPPKFLTRLMQLFGALGAMIVSAGWWILIVEFWPASSRPWVGGSQNNSILELTLGYNGFGRLSGDETGSVTPGRGGMGGGMGADMAGGMPGGMPGGIWGETGILRMFDASQGGQIAWLLPAALILFVVGLVLRGRAPRTDGQRASLIVWGSWLLVTGLTFSFMAGIFHAYYTVALAPAVAALIGIGSVVLWRRRDTYWVRIAMAAAVASTVAMAWVLLRRSESFVPWLKWAILVVGVVAVVTLLVPALTRGRLAAASILAVMFAGLAGPTAYAVDTIGTSHTGAIVSAGPNTGMRGFGGMGEGRRGQGGMPGGMQLPAGVQLPAGMQPPAGFPGQAGAPGQMPGGAEMGGMGGAMGGLLEGSKPTTAITEMLEQDADSYTWVAAAIGANTAAGYQLATEEPVMPVGGFNGTDPSPTLAEFQQYVAEGQIHYFIGGGGMPGMESGTSAEISAWVTENFTATTVDNVTFYDLTQ
ncbi:glycosyl transferase [Rhodococcus sp. 15-725-2-2b]|uniref:ArnT family glycosyltransferase n=1 Tax=unclassified Rhodococcus (in: high G+C Gram-positive bacteria) TaxID=192944 RepID=UPI000B9BCAD9|nr:MULTISPECIES: glycosyltransferase family 39 protein [unclassified Rhodococcus (in: high G+C Gram-positive bacteria)]OZC62914.1 glycosyl transferase [Rhodococcus sp. 06-469-3-2]OZD49847.1 glycosyl transferase [Rhodococcus sp. 06-1477-1A]OZE77859.1 glycosyl transferase [Rhodococcus sp. 15-725-2-2b]